jgi:hypothetical protein
MAVGIGIGAKAGREVELELDAAAPTPLEARRELYVLWDDLDGVVRGRLVLRRVRW